MLHTLGDLGRTVARLNQDIPALGTESCGDGLCEGVNTLEESCASLDAELELLRDDQYAGLTSFPTCVMYLVCEPLLLEVEAPGAVQRRSARSGCEALHCDGRRI